MPREFVGHGKVCLPQWGQVKRQLPSGTSRGGRGRDSREERNEGAARIRTGDGGFAIRCLSRLATAPSFLATYNVTELDAPEIFPVRWGFFRVIPPMRTGMNISLIGSAENPGNLTLVFFSLFSYATRSSGEKGTLR